MHPVITSSPQSPSGITWRYCQIPDLPFDPVVFNAQQLRTRGMITGAARAGRGNTFFFTHCGQPLVLRHYHRGGLVQHISKNRYLFTGLESTRSMQEFSVLVRLHQRQFPVSVPYACQVVRSGLLYRASLVTHKLDAMTLAERLELATQRPLSESVWAAIGDTLARLHGQGVYHADLNAHNIMLDDQGCVSVIDFDRAQLRDVPRDNPASGWCLANIHRLERSLAKISGDNPAYAQGFITLRQHWMQALCAQPEGA